MALRPVDADSRQGVGAILIFDPFGDGAKSEIACEVLESAKDAPALRGPDPLHEPSVELDEGKRQFGEVAKRRVAAAEVIQGKADAEGEKWGQRSAHGIEIAQELPFGDLDDQGLFGVGVRATWHRRACDAIKKILYPFRVVQKVDGDVHEIGNARAPGLALSRAVLDDLADHVVIEPMEPLKAIGCLDEVLGLQHAFRCDDARKGLFGHDVPVA